ncbi:helix-turn-helix domain-containing protein [Aestuariicella sp. G3-2]|uniref:helix-turn-helix domain-containing protein n=1 Tax=Pseudomaricurvus albidus TaxID=2842452 RepID=UPI001C0E8C77|nr:helix-turn-helix domain-containing protein [Aestuariicella albida]MBU3068786.1 helix-turn-helix domain-containing protein [Aestuariicella albida]
MDSVDLKAPIHNAVLPPVSSQTQFASWIGVTPDTVRGWVENQTIPTVKIGRQRFIDVVSYMDAVKRGKTIFQRGDFNES